MAKSKDSVSKPVRNTRATFSDEAKEKQMISLAIDQAEEMLRNKTAPTPIVTHYLKLGTTLAKIELERAKLENDLVKAKTESLQSTKKLEEMYADALSAMKLYSGKEEADDE